MLLPMWRIKNRIKEELKVVMVIPDETEALDTEIVGVPEFVL